MIDPSAHPDAPLGLPDPPKDWFEFWVRFVCGALLGIVFATLFCLRFFYSTDCAWLAIPASGLLCALGAARYGDNFWVALRAIRWRW